jgi:hypothetical protein
MQKAFNKIQYHFMIKAVRKVGIEGMYLNIVKDIHDKPIANIILHVYCSTIHDGQVTETAKIHHY